jgi:methylmalonyl-CoA mutase cobalamin-binding subunit
MKLLDSTDEAAGGLQPAAFSGAIPGPFTRGVLSRVAVERPRRQIPESSALVGDFCATLRHDSPGPAREFVSRLRAAGMGVERIFLDLLPAAARRLGQMWADDAMSFADVTHCSAELQRLIRELGPEFCDTGRAGGGPVRRVLLALVPSESHSIGLLITAEELRRRGWDVDVLLHADASELACQCRAAMYDAIGLSAGSRSRIEALGAAVRLVRTSACVGTPVVVGGPIVDLEPDIAARVGADFAATSGRALSERIREGLVLP